MAKSPSKPSAQPSRQPAAPPSRSRAPWIIGAVVALVVIIFAAVMVTSGGGDDETASGGTGTGSAVVTGAVTVTGTKLPTIPEGGSDPAVGTAFPSLAGTNLLDGSPLTIGADGRAKLVVFVAHWCPHCQREVPVITKWIAANGMPDDVELYAVSTAVAKDRGNFPPASWLVREQWPVRTLADDTDGSAFQAAGLTSFPSFVAVGADGKVKARTSGELTTAEFEQLLATARG